jgi:hypothetical protein
MNDEMKGARKLVAQLTGWDVRVVELSGNISVWKGRCIRERGLPKTKTAS